MRSIYSYIFCLEVLLLLYNLHIFASDQINEESKTDAQEVNTKHVAKAACPINKRLH